MNTWKREVAGFKAFCLWAFKGDSCRLHKARLYSCGGTADRDHANIHTHTSKEGVCAHVCVCNSELLPTDSHCYYHHTTLLYSINQNCTSCMYYLYGRCVTPTVLDSVLCVVTCCSLLPVLRKTPHFKGTVPHLGKYPCLFSCPV